MQAKALRSAVDSGLEVPPEVIDLAIRSVREHYCPHERRPRPARIGAAEAARAVHVRQGRRRRHDRDGGGGVVCLQEFGQYDDWRIAKNMEVISAAIQRAAASRGSRDGQMPFDAYTLYYVGQALYQVGGEHWKENYPQAARLPGRFADATSANPQGTACGTVAKRGGRVGGKTASCTARRRLLHPGHPNRYLPILQEGRSKGLRRSEAERS